MLPSSYSHWFTVFYHTSGRDYINHRQTVIASRDWHCAYETSNSEWYCAYETSNSEWYCAIWHEENKIISLLFYL